MEPAKSRDLPVLKVIHGGKKKKPNFLPFLIVGIIITAIFFGRKGFNDVVEYDESGKPQLTSQRLQEIERAKEKLDHAEVYFLISNADQFIECFLCPGGKMWIKKGETAKIGTTINPRSRYGVKYYAQHNVNYQLMFRGSIDQVLKKEIELLGAYPLWPENTNRKAPLLVPPLNTKLK